MKRNSTNVLFSILALMALVLTSCENDDTVTGGGAAGLNSLITTQVEAAGVNCFAGGLKINYGLDANSNNILDTEEIQHFDFVCNGVSEPVQLDHLIRVLLGSPDITGCTTDWTVTPYDSWMLHDFNKMDYYNVTEILFVPSMVNFQEGNKVTVELFNVTDNVPIANSEIVHSQTDFIVRYSGDIFDNLPAYPVTLAVRVKNSMPDACGGLGTFSYLYLIRD